MRLSIGGILFACFRLLFSKPSEIISTTTRLIEMSNKGGYIYILSNPSMPGVLKIGKTKRPPEVRVKELSSATGVPTPFHIEGVIEATDMSAVEKEVHLHIANRRVNNRREFFRIDVSQAVRIAGKVATRSKSKFRRERQNAYFRFIDPVLFTAAIFLSIFTVNQTAASAWLAIATVAAITGKPKVVSEVMKLPSLFGNYTRVIFVLGLFIALYAAHNRQHFLSIVYEIIEISNTAF